jgi:acyl carrier protein
MMTREEIKKEVIESMHEIKSSLFDETDEIDENKSLNDMGFDSMDGVELIMEFEKRFGIGIPDDDVEGITYKPIAWMIDYMCNLVWTHSEK